MLYNRDLKEGIREVFEDTQPQMCELVIITRDIDQRSHET